MLFTSENESFIPVGVAYSQAMCVRNNTDLYDCFFLYTVSNDRKNCVAPLAILSLCNETGKVVEYKIIEDYKKIPLDNQYGESEIIEAIDTYEKFYPSFRLLIGKDSLNDAEIAVIKSIYDSFSVFANTDLQKVYRDCCPQMFEFIDSIIQCEE